MSAGAYNIYVEQGATYDQTFTWRDGAGALVNVTGYTARMQWRTAHSAPATVFDGTTDATFTLGGAAGTIRIQITAAKTAGVAAAAYYYDLEMLSSTGVVTRLLQGTVTVNPEVTK